MTPSSAHSPGAGQPDRLYVASGRISNAAMRCRTREELLEEAVRLPVESGPFAMAFIAWHDPDTGELVPGARFGDATGYCDRGRFFADERDEGRGPGGIAFRTNTACVSSDFMNDVRTAHWHDAAAVAGWRSSAAVPVRIGGVPRGVLNVYSRVSGFFGPLQLDLLHEVMTAVSLGLERLESEDQRRQAEAALAASEQRLKRALDAGGIGLWDYDLESGMIVWDGHSERIFGLEPGRFGGTYADFLRQVHPADVEKLNRAAAEHAAAGTPFTLEFRVIWPDGSIHWVESHGEYSFSDSGRPVTLRGAALDITARKESELALRDNEDRLRQAVRVANIGIFDHDHRADTIHWSPELLTILAVGQDERPTMDAVRSRVHPGDWARFDEEVRRSQDPVGDGTFDIEHRLLLPDGSLRWIASKAQTAFEGEGATRYPVRTVGAVSDITARRRAEVELRNLASVVSMSSEFMGVATLDGQVVYVNAAAMKLLGIGSLEEARSKTIFDFLFEDHREFLRDVVIPAVMATGSWTGEAVYRHFRSGAPIDVEMTAFRIHDENGAPIYIATVTRDISDRKKALAERATLEEKLVQVQKMESIGRLAGGVAHDFNNMLTVILGYVALAKTKAGPSGPISGYLDEIERAAGRSREITRQLLGFSRRQIIAPEPIDLNRLLADLQQPLSRLIGEDVDLSIWPQHDLWRASLDSSQVNQILLNLVINARDALPNGGKITLETANVEIDVEYCRTQVGWTPGQYVMLGVSDNGVGMTRETMAHLFEPFFTTKEVGRGTGLGLATVYGIVKQNSGFINVYSEPSQGTTFRIYFPRVGSDADKSPEAEAFATPSGAGTILLVEDDDLVRSVTKAALEVIGYTPLVADSAEAALRICLEPDTRVHLILTDVIMSGMTGAELRDRVSAVRPDIKVLFMSGYTSNVIVNHGVLKQGVHFIQKPFSLEQLARKIAEVLEGPGRATSA